MPPRVRWTLPPRDAGGRFLPSLETLSKRSDDALRQTLQRFGIMPDVERLRAVVDTRLAQLMAADNPSAALIERTQRAIENGIRDELAATAKRYVREQELRAHGLRGKGALDRDAIWVAVLTGSCEDCTDRHGEEESMRVWNGRGLPGSPNLLCSHRCRCYLLPLEMVAGDEEEAA